MKTSTFIVLSFVLLLVSCRKEQPAIDEIVTDDPCAEENLMTGFQIGASIGGPTWGFHNSDYAFTGRNLKFQVDKNCFDFYEFQIGANVYYQDCVIVYFDQYDTVKNLPIKLITKKYDVLCDNYVGSDTVIRYLNTYDKCDWPMLGTFRGVTSEFPTDSFDIYISNSFIDGTGSQSCNAVNITNFNNSGCYSPWSLNNFSLTKGNYGGVLCNGSGGRYLFDPLGETLQLNYVISTAPDYIKSDTIIFKGKKI